MADKFDFKKLIEETLKSQETGTFHDQLVRKCLVDIIPALDIMTTLVLSRDQVADFQELERLTSERSGDPREIFLGTAAVIFSIGSSIFENIYFKPITKGAISEVAMYRADILAEFTRQYQRLTAAEIWMNTPKSK
jgi:hypothetical protein